jgi:hypothetical protein
MVSGTGRGRWCNGRAYTTLTTPDEMRSGAMDYEICRLTDGADPKAQRSAAMGFERRVRIVARID